MGTDWYKAKNMHKLSLDYRVETMGEEMKELLDEIYSLSRKGEFSLVVKKISRKDRELLKALGYEVTVDYVDGDEFLGLIGGEIPYYNRVEEFTIAWD